MAQDREREKFEQDRDRLFELQGDARAKEWNRQMRESKRKQLQAQYLQPQEAAWREFLQYRGWTIVDIDEFPKDWLYIEYMRYWLRNHYGIGND